MAFDSAGRIAGEFLGACVLSFLLPAFTGSHEDRFTGAVLGSFFGGLAGSFAGLWLARSIAFRKR